MTSRGKAPHSADRPATHQRNHTKLGGREQPESPDTRVRRRLNAALCKRTSFRVAWSETSDSARL